MTLGLMFAILTGRGTQLVTTVDLRGITLLHNPARSLLAQFERTNLCF